MTQSNESFDAEILERLERIKENLSHQRRFPISTYRLQLNRDFTFRHAVEIVPYLHEMGITHCYTSPYLTAEQGSSHGYDICNYNQLNPELGGEEAFEEFAAELDRFGMGHILDFVPNHMGIASERNGWWQNVLENGRCSPHAEFFDIDWTPIKKELCGKVLLPNLGDQYGDVLERGELVLELCEGSFFIRYYDHRLPVNPGSLPSLLEHNLGNLQNLLAEDDPKLLEFLSIITTLKHLPPTTETDPEKIRERSREKEIIRSRFMKLLEEAPVIRTHIAETLKIFNGNPEDPGSFDLLHRLLEQQVYRLSYWRTAAHEINYRRFFDINHLVGIQMEREEVFQLAHTLILKQLAEGKIHGLRLDHVDGLYDPASYFDRLQEAILFERALQDPVLAKVDPDILRGQIHHWRWEEAAKDPGGPVQIPLFVVVEKILTGHETLPAHWSVCGTSGYDFLNQVNELFVDASNEPGITHVYTRFTGITQAYSEIVYESKKLIMQTSLASELNVLAHALNVISEKNRHHRDFTLYSLRDALREVVALFPIYRTYLDATGYNPEDRDTLQNTIFQARHRNTQMEPTIFNFIRDILLPIFEEGPSPDTTRYNFIMKLQQFTPPVQAKGLEDTAFYRFNRLISLNEVGGHPTRFGVSPSAFHAWIQKRQKAWPFSLNSTATHDHKRGEDARCRINVLSEIPDEWRKVIRRWSLVNRSKRSLVDNTQYPDRNDEFLLYQTLVGMWPMPPGSTQQLPKLAERLVKYMQKATNESKVHTSWINPNLKYHDALKKFIERLLAPGKNNRFLQTFLSFHEPAARAGTINSLAQVVLKSTLPGIPDFYQGTELWDLSLVDPDNRQPVDYALRRKFLQEIKSLLPGEEPREPGLHRKTVLELLDNWMDGRIKLFITACVLRHRRAHPQLFLKGDYQPLTVEGPRAEHVVAFARQKDEEATIAILPRLCARFMAPGVPWPVGEAFWQDTRVLLPANLANSVPLQELFTREPVEIHEVEKQSSISVGKALSVLPVACLIRAPRERD
ncbi:MAG: malto-oligosyltrehalose synthase [Nitrospinae bacterium CG11_big_fil_rev_8_21_14_0_20_56_8]|nr:MAG: malto-oligosyltrehalose synthase [Nitrospinae bacterium CG11_big_fil_rev_8_21_14_0_20_56_8]